MKRASLEQRDYLDHMLDAVVQIQSYTHGKTEATFHAERLLQDAVIRNLEVLGEAANNLLRFFPAAITQFPGIPFAAIYGMRNMLTHGYFAIDLDVVWRVVEQDVPDLRRQLDFALQTLGS